MSPSNVQKAGWGGVDSSLARGHGGLEVAQLWLCRTGCALRFGQACFRSSGDKYSIAEWIIRSHEV